MPKLGLGLGLGTKKTIPTGSVPATALSYLGNLLNYIGQFLTFTP
jgi:hypothetical protein